MACMEGICKSNLDYEREEGEIIDEVDDLSDISSEEEFLLRQRLQVLESYNHVLERKKSKDSSFNVGDKRKWEDTNLLDLSEISATELEEVCSPHKTKDLKDFKKNKQKKRKCPQIQINKSKYSKKKNNKSKRKEVKIISESSEESDDEYRNKRRKLANAVTLNKGKNDSSSLKARLIKMLCPMNEELENHSNPQFKVSPCPVPNDSVKVNLEVSDTIPNQNVTSVIEIDDHIKEIPETTFSEEFIDLCSDTEKNVVSCDIVDSVENKDKSRASSDDDLELLRQHALETKSIKSKENAIIPSEQRQSEGEDSDISELRMICLKSAFLKKAIEMKKKQKLQKKLSQSSNINDDFVLETNEIILDEKENNTDIESVDMDIGSDLDDKGKECCISKDSNLRTFSNGDICEIVQNNVPQDDDEIEDDEDLLRAKLLTSLSKNLPNLVDPNIIDSIEAHKKESNEKAQNEMHIQQDKRIIINLGESDSEGENEATKNLTKMHMKLSEQVDFEQRLDIFLKSKRMEVENKELSDIVQEPQIGTPKPIPKTAKKFVPKAVKHLPKPEQIEYRNLVKRMAELEKIKKNRQLNISIPSNTVHAKDTLKPRNVVVDIKTAALNNLDEKIALSRKKIAEESASMLRLKEEATKLSQKYQIVATELHNLSTAITLNKKQQRSTQIRLTKIRASHQLLLKSSSLFQHSKINTLVPLVNRTNEKSTPSVRLQKENDPTKEEYKNPQMLKSVKVNNDVNEETRLPNSRLSIEIDVTNNKKTVKIASPAKDRTDDIKGSDLPSENSEIVENIHLTSDNDNASFHPLCEKGGGGSLNDTRDTANVINRYVDDYRSPLDALESATWEEDPNAVLCPFEFGGNCKDADCKYLHPKMLSTQ